MRRRAWWMSLALAVPLMAQAADPAGGQYRKSYRHEGEGKYAEALADIDALGRDERSSYVYQLRRGWLLYLLGRHWDSIEAYRAAIDIHPRAVEPRLGLMLPTMALRLWLDVVEVGKGATKLDPLNYTANSRMAWAYYSLGKFADAEAYYRKVLSAYPSDVEMRTGLGWSLLQQKRNAEARKELDAVLRIAPDHLIAKAGRDAAGS